MTEEYYRRNHLFSFEDLVTSELAVLRECLAPGGKAERWSARRFGSRPDQFFYMSIQRRMGRDGNSSSADVDGGVASAAEGGGNDNNNSDYLLHPLVDLDESCYSETKSRWVPREQWRDVAVEQPRKILALPNLHLVQSIVGRGVYALPLGWWYEMFSTAGTRREEHIRVVCTEDMAKSPNDAMDDVTEFLGLPEYDFSRMLRASGGTTSAVTRGTTRRRRRRRRRMMVMRTEVGEMSSRTTTISWPFPTPS